MATVAEWLFDLVYPKKIRKEIDLQSTAGDVKEAS